MFSQQAKLNYSFLKIHVSPSFCSHEIILTQRALIAHTVKKLDFMSCSRIIPERHSSKCQKARESRWQERKPDSVLRNLTRSAWTSFSRTFRYHFPLFRFKWNQNQTNQLLRYLFITLRLSIVPLLNLICIHTGWVYSLGLVFWN